MSVPDLDEPGWRARIADARARLQELIDTLQTWPWLDTLKTLGRRFREDRLGVTASSLTFTTTIALVPLATVMLAAFSAFPMFKSLQAAVERYFLRSLVPDSIAKPVLGALTQFALKANSLGGAGLIFLVITAMALMLTIDRTLNGIWRVKKPRPIAQRVLVYWAAATLGPLLLGISLTGTSYAITASRGVVEGLPGGVKVVFGVLQFVLLAGGMAALFRYVPNTEVRWRHAWAGGVFVAIGVELAKRAAAWYLAAVPTYSAVYGAFATVPIFLIWLYLGWVIVLLGAVIAAYAPSLQMRVVRRPATPGHRFALAVAVLRELAQARAHDARGVSLADLSEQMRTDPLQIEPALELFADLDWVGRLDEDRDKRYVLLCDPTTTAAQPLLSALLLEPAPTLRNFWQRAGFDGMSLGELIA